IILDGADSKSPLSLNSFIKKESPDFQNYNIRKTQRQKPGDSGVTKPPWLRRLISPKDPRR
ncbi:MAG: hypothetical protein ACRD43_04285, partial [Pyrinomonadaceae bacterium]